MFTRQFSGFILLTQLFFSPALYAKAENNSALSDDSQHILISRGGDAGIYQAFPDACRLKNGDIVAVFYAGDEHVTKQSKDYPNAGRICLVRSKDEGRTWSTPVTIYDDADDNRDPHISQLRDGTVIVSFFSLRYPYFGAREYKSVGGPQLIRSRDNGKTWEKKATLINAGSPDWYCSAQVREMPDGTLILPVYYQKDGKIEKAWGGVVRSSDKGKTWGPVITIGENENLPLAAETDVVLLKDGTLYAALRAEKPYSMHYAVSKDLGKSWNKVKDIGFKGHSPSFTRLKTGEILLSIRAFKIGGKESGYTGLRISRDEAKTWEGPYLVDETLGAYPSTVELKDGTILVVYYEEGKGSGIRTYRFKLPESSNGQQFSTEKRLEVLNLK
jgi:sialidase-1